MYISLRVNTHLKSDIFIVPLETCRSLSVNAGPLTGGWWVGEAVLSQGAPALLPALLCGSLPRMYSERNDFSRCLAGSSLV